VSWISIVVPARNEARIIATTLEHLQPWRTRGAEIILVDGHSSDRTAATAAPLCDRVLVCDPGRAAQMNAGAAAANGELLLFLHADTQLPAEAEAELQRITARDGAVWGRFDVALDAPGVAYRVIETMMNLRSRLTGIATGDQAVFVSRALFARVRGFPDLALMEDIELSKRLRAIRRPICLRSRVRTSARRWQEHGIVPTVVKMWWLRCAYFLGVSPARLGASYERHDVADR